MALVFGGYILVGVIRAIFHISSGRVGTKGPISTFIFVTLLWPMLLGRY